MEIFGKRKGALGLGDMASAAMAFVVIMVVLFVGAMVGNGLQNNACPVTPVTTINAVYMDTPTGGYGGTYGGTWDIAPHDALKAVDGDWGTFATSVADDEYLSNNYTYNAFDTNVISAKYESKSNTSGGAVNTTIPAACRSPTNISIYIALDTVDTGNMSCKNWGTNAYDVIKTGIGAEYYEGALWYSNSSTTQTNVCTGSNGYSIALATAANGLSAITALGTWLPLLALVIAGAVILAVVSGALGGMGKEGTE
jgi:hypothetical protein